MAVLTAKGIASVALELLSRQLVLPRTVTNVPGSDFVGPNGGTITVRVPQPGSSHDQANPGDNLTADDVTEIPVDVTLKHVYHLKNISDQEATYSLEDFASQITRVQVDAVASGAEDKIVAVMNAATAEGAPYQFALAADDEDTKSVLLAAREFLSDARAPLSNRYLACAPDIITRLLHLLTPVNQAGDNSALRDAIVGRIYGMDVIEVPGLTDGTAVAYHKSGFAFANRMPALPKGATQAFGVAAQGLTLRQVFQYASGSAQDQSLLSTMAGAAAVYENGTGTNGTDNKRWVKLDTSAT